MNEAMKTGIYDPKTGAMLMSVREAAAYLGYNEFSVRNQISKGGLKPHCKVGNKPMFLKEQLDQYKATNAWAARKAELKVPADAEPHQMAPSGLKAIVRLEVTPAALVGWTEPPIEEFSWEQLPLIRARIHNVHGDIPFDVEISGPDGGTWRINYQPPTWIENLWKHVVGK